VCSRIMLLVSETPISGEHNRRMLEKLLFSAKIPRRFTKEINPLEVGDGGASVAVAFGFPAAKLLLGGNSRFTLKSQIGHPRPCVFNESLTIVACHHPDHLLRHGIGPVRETVLALKLAYRILCK
jgi:hypothetical protein